MYNLYITKINILLSETIENVIYVAKVTNMKKITTALVKNINKLYTYKLQRNIYVYPYVEMSLLPFLLVM